MRKQVSLLIAGSAGSADAGLSRALSREFALVEWADDLPTADRLLPRCHFDCIVVHAGSPHDPALDWVSRVRRQAGPGPTILVAGDADADLAAAAQRAGATGCLAGPLNAGALREAVNGRFHTGRVVRGVDLVGDSPAIRAVEALVARIAPTPATVLVEGETGAGKELVARLLHRHSRRRGPFVPVNCGAIAPELMESELFGHAKGAYTGAHQVREGLFVAAQGGTLFLDEIGSTPRDLQIKLLRALEERAVRPVGADREVPVDARIIASTQPGLTGRVAAGDFREDLYYRLHVAHIVLPPLRDRPGDVAALARHFLVQAAAEFGMPPIDLDQRRLQWLCAQPWPGNVRELRNVIERAVLLGDLPESAAVLPASREAQAGAYPVEWTLEQVKQAHMRRVVETHGGNKSAAARQLGISRKTLERKLGLPPDAPAD